MLYWYKPTNTDAAGIRDAPLVEALTAKLLRIPLRAVEARAAANIAWSAAVEESTDPALLCWIWRSIDLLLPLMQADGLSQVANNYDGLSQVANNYDGLSQVANNLTA